MEKVDNEVKSESAFKIPNPQVVPNAAEANNEFGSIRLPSFWKSRPKLWFVQLEYQFVGYGIRSDAAKVGIVLRHLDEETILNIAHVLEEPLESNKYEQIKIVLIEKYSEWLEKFKMRLEEIELGEKNPSVLLQEMRTLAGSNITDDVLKKLWLQKLPKITQELLIVVQDSMILDKVAEFADKLLEGMLLALETTSATDADTIKKLTEQVHNLTECAKNMPCTSETTSSMDVDMVKEELEKLKDEIEKIRLTREIASLKDADTIKNLKEQVQKLSSAEPGSKNDERFRQVHLDLMGPMYDCDGYSYCLVMVDHYTRWPEATPITDASADTIARAFVATWVSRFGAPAIITTDQASQFEARLFAKLTKLLGCQRIVSPPNSNCFLDQWHCTLHKSFVYQLQNDYDWLTGLPLVLLGLRTAYRADLQCSPSAKLYDKNIKLPNEFFEESYEPVEPDTFVQELRDKMYDIRPRCLYDFNAPTSFRQKALHEATHVFVKDNTMNGLPLLQPYDGPFKILERIKNDFCTLMVHGKLYQFPVDRLQPAFEEIVHWDSD